MSIHLNETNNWKVLYDQSYQTYFWGPFTKSWFCRITGVDIANSNTIMSNGMTMHSGAVIGNVDVDTGSWATPNDLMLTFREEIADWNVEKKLNKLDDSDMKVNTRKLKWCTTIPMIQTTKSVLWNRNFAQDLKKWTW